MTETAAASRLKPLTQESTVDRVTMELRRSILAGHLPPGQPFSITEIAEQLGVSHIPVREALRRLEGMGLVQLRAGRSAIVAPIDTEELKAVYRLRRLLEVDLAGRAVKGLIDEDVVKMEEAISIYYSDSPQPDEALARHHEFHMILLRPASTEWDWRVLELLWGTSERYIRLVFADLLLDRTRAQALGHSHDVLIEAARAGSVERIKRGLRKHLEANEAVILSSIAAVGH